MAFVSPPTSVSVGKKLLFVEDEKGLRDTLREIFLNLGYTVEVAEHGAAALEVFKERQPDLVISDVSMPVMDGYQLLRQIKALPGGKRIPVILLTAKAAHDEKLHGLEEGANDYVTKPFDYAELQLRIENLLSLANSFQHEGKDDEPNDEIDSFFLRNLNQYLEKNLREGRLELDLVAGTFRLSPSGLQKKIKRLTNKSYSRYVREYRLKRAHELLMTNQYSIGEVATIVGFSTNSYFSESFRDLYGFVPSKLIS